MKKFKEIMATMLAVVLTVAAVVVYAPTEAYAAATSHKTILTVKADSSDSINFVSWDEDQNSIVAGEDGITITVKNNGNYSIHAVISCYYDNSEFYEYKTSGISSGYNPSDSLSYSSIKKLFSGNNVTAPTNIGVKYSYVIDETDTSYPVHVNVTFYDADKVSPTSDAVSSSSVTAHTHTWKYGTIFDATEDTDGLEGYYCSCGANKETTVIPSITAIYKNRYTQMDQAGKGEVITLKMGEWNTYSKEFMQHLISATERGVTIKLDYKYEKKNYVTTVPAGTTMDLAYDYYGPLFIQSLFETTKLN